MPVITTNLKLRLERTAPLSRVPKVEGINCQKKSEPACTAEIDQRTESRGRIGPRRVVTVPSITNSPQAKAVKDVYDQEVCGLDIAAGSVFVAEDIGYSRGALFFRQGRIRILDLSPHACSL